MASFWDQAARAIVLSVVWIQMATTPVLAFGIGTTTKKKAGPSRIDSALATPIGHHHPHRLQYSSTRLYFSYYTQVISDVDDTLKSSGGVNVGGVVTFGGIDVQYERGFIYPGVVEFLFQLSCYDLPSVSRTSSTNSTNTPTHPKKLLPPKVAILTARAEEFKAAMELKSTSPLVQALEQVGRRHGVPGWGLGPVLYGSVAEWIVHDRKGLRKFTNFERLLQQDPTGQCLRYVYLGDTGEWDSQAGETMLREYPELVRAVFLHVVSAEKDPEIVMIPPPPPKFIHGRPVVYFRTYVGAALAAVQLNLMSLDGLEHVMEAAQKQLAGFPKSSDKWRDLQVDIDRARRVL